MSANFKVTVTDNSTAVRAAMESMGDNLLEALGIEAVKNTVTNITAAGRVDTGLYRNSFTYALSGHPAAQESYKGDNKSKHRPKAPIPSGVPYSGAAPGGQQAVYVGSNLDYALYQEEGYRLPSGAHVAGTHALRRGVEQLANGDAEKIAKALMKNA